ncbi:MAG: Zn-ribbon domain-containing OB-fold protein [Desulfurococcales archaeon]|nr:Zn-ribbon domain-containing OB-fold protein [Desulfurococcales archaeon]
MSKKYPGTYLKRDEMYSLPGLVRYKPVAKYSFSAGIAQTKFLEGLKKGKIIGVKCPSCGRVYVPPRAFCEYCHVPMNEYVELPGTGEIHTAVISYISTFRQRMDKPEIVGVVKLDAPGYTKESYEFAGLFHRFCGITEEDVISGKAIGMKVKPRWKPENERTGSVTDIECFEPVES